MKQWVVVLRNHDGLFECSTVVEAPTEEEARKAAIRHYEHLDLDLRAVVCEEVLRDG